MLMRTDPFRDLDRLTEAVLGTRSRPAVMPMDAYRRGDQFYVEFDLPGVDPSSVELTVEKNVLTVKAERRWQRQDGDEYIVAERPQGSYTRQIFLGDTLDTEHIEAHYDQGVLKVVVPVAEQAKPRKVEIASGSGRKAIEAETTAA